MHLHSDIYKAVAQAADYDGYDVISAVAQDDSHVPGRTLVHCLCAVAEGYAVCTYDVRDHGIHRSHGDRYEATLAGGKQFTHDREALREFMWYVRQYGLTA